MFATKENKNLKNHDYKNNYFLKNLVGSYMNTVLMCVILFQENCIQTNLSTKTYTHGRTRYTDLNSNIQQTI